MKSNTIRLSLGAALAGILSLSPLANADVYTLSNSAEGNEVLAFDLDDKSGAITALGSFSTGGTGSGAPLGNQSALVTDASDRWLFATNAGDGSLTSFRLQSDGLQFVNNIASGGSSAISVTVYGTLVYVLNEGTGNANDAPEDRYDNISGFRFTGGGVLQPIPGSTRILDDTRLTAPAQIGFNKSGTVLLVTEKVTNMLTTYVMGDDDRPAQAPIKRPSAVPTPFGFAFGDRDYVFITEANGGSQGVTASYRIDRVTGTVSSLVDLIDQGDAACWTVLTNDEKIGYSVNTGSGSISPYRVNFNGTIEPFFDANPSFQFPTGTSPRDAVLTQDGRFILTLNNGDGQLRVARVGRDGTLSNAIGGTLGGRRGASPASAGIDIPTSATGLMAR
ncbi:MAG: lactonase family protein [Gammaproteobacteria bacterium]